MDFSFDNLLTRGYHITRYEYIDAIPVEEVVFDEEDDHVRFPSTIPQSVITAHQLFVEHVKHLLLGTYATVEPLDPHECTGLTNNVMIWDGVDSNTQNWHCDGSEGGDVFVLLYFDDMVNEGAIHFRSPTSDSLWYPRRGDVIFVSNSPTFNHRAERTGRHRRVMNVAFTCVMV